LTIRRRFWERWRITTHSDISTVFEVPVPDAVFNEIAADDDMTRHLIRRQFASRTDQQQQQNPHPPSQQPNQPTQQQQNLQPQKSPQTPGGSSHRVPGRRDSIAPFPGLRAELQGVFSESEEVSDITSRLEALEEGLQRIEMLLGRLVGSGDGNGNAGFEHGIDTGTDAGTGTGTGTNTGNGSDNEEAVLSASPETMPRRRSLSLVELNREAEE
jgi:hypothetical protein